MANFDLHSWLTGYIFSVVGKELKLPVLEHPAVQWRLSPSIITTDGAEANDRVWGFSNIDDEFLLVTTSSSKLYQSYDGISWNYVADIPFSYTNDIMRVNGVYYNVPTYSKTMYYSEDLIIWTACSFPSGHPINTVGSYQYSNGKFFCSSAGNGNTYLYYSDDGKSWYSKLLSSGPLTTGSTWWGSFSFKYYPELSIFLGVAARLDYLYYSTNGTSWTYIASGANYAPDYNNGVFLYYVRNIDANPRYLEVYKSEDGKNWYCTYHEDLDDNASDYTQLCFTYLNGIWYMCSTGCGLSFRSVDNGETWESFDVLPEVYGGVYAFGKYWLRNEISTSSPYGAVSDDGEHWEVIPDARIVNAEIDDGLALDGLLSYSTDGINWYDTNILTIKQETPSDHMFGSDPPVKFKNMWVSIYYKENSRYSYKAKYYESRLLYLPVLAKEPTAYSYNGVVLPKLPEWDKTVYPYAFLYSIFPTKYGFVVSDTIPYRKDGKIYVGNAMATMVSGDMEVFPIPTAGNELVRESYGNAIWTKPPHDILNEDGTIYLAASDPIPVYE